MEEWRDIPRCEGYQVSNLGRVRSVDRLVVPRKSSSTRTRRLKGRVLALTLDAVSGYLRVSFFPVGAERLVTRRVARLVAEAFLGPCPAGMEVAHNNGVKTDNRLENLRYATPKENHADKRLHGTGNAGEKHPLAKLSEDDVREIRRRRGVTTQRELALLFGLSEVYVADIQRRRAWKHVD